MNKPYDTELSYETNSLRLRLVRPDDAPDLLACYSDPLAVAKMNADSCQDAFFYQTLEKMREAIGFWLGAYEVRAFVRLSVLSKECGRAIGTIEFFGEDCPGLGRAGLLRIDLATAWETPRILDELTALGIGSLMPDFGVAAMLVKAAHTPERARVFSNYGFVPTDEFRPGLGYMIYRQKDVAYCGLACCVCGENRDCPGCQRGGCEAHGWCENYNCCRERGVAGCWECQEFPCGKGMLAKMRPRAFARFAGQYGAAELIRCLTRNKAAGIVYHEPGQLVGDYDKCRSEAEIMEMIRSGKPVCGEDASRRGEDRRHEL